jgi:hypothetical protein
MKNIQIFFYIFIVAVAFMYFIYYKRGKNPLLVPGDYYRVKAERAYYFPLGGALVITALLYFLLKVVF